jgi:RNA polymerase sigma-70 factor (ECF subfamily)
LDCFHVNSIRGQYSERREEIGINELFLIRQAQRGNVEALETLIVKYYNNIFAYLTHRTGQRELAEDLTQETFLRLVSSIASYRPTGKFSNFIFTIAVNVCNDHYRKKTVEVVDNVDLDALADNTGTENALENLERVGVLKETIDRLPDMQREALLLRFYHDMKIKDIARITGVPIPTVKSRINQGLGKLRKLLGSEDI